MNNSNVGMVVVKNWMECRDDEHDISFLIDLINYACDDAYHKGKNQQINDSSWNLSHWGQ